MESAEPKPKRWKAWRFSLVIFGLLGLLFWLLAAYQIRQKYHFLGDRLPVYSTHFDADVGVAEADYEVYSWKADLAKTFADSGKELKSLGFTKSNKFREDSDLGQTWERGGTSIWLLGNVKEELIGKIPTSMGAPGWIMVSIHIDTPPKWSDRVKSWLKDRGLTL